MAQAARPLPSAPDLPAPQRLRAVPPPRTAARRPSPAVIRRRRAVALGGLVALILLAIAALSIGGSASASGQISDLLRRGAAVPASLCDHLSPAMLAAAGGHSGCLHSSPARGPDATVGGIRIHGDSATAVVHRPDTDELVTLIRHNGAWQID